MLHPGSACLACGGTTHLRYKQRTDEPSRPENARCTSTDLGNYHDIWACPDCGLAFQVVPDGLDELIERYEQVEDPLYLTQETQRRVQFRELLQRVAEHQPPGRLLEIGSFAGLFLDEARRAGWDTVGIEPSRWAVQHARRAYGVNIIQGTIQDFDPGPERFDAVCAWDVLEHVMDPLDMLGRSHELLRPGGVLGLTTINIEGLAARILRRRWPWLMRMHLYYFTPLSLKLLLERTGFEILELMPHAKRLSIAYVLKRSEPYMGPLARILRLVRNSPLAQRSAKIQLGDLMVVFARPLEGNPT